MGTQLEATDHDGLFASTRSRPAELAAPFLPVRSGSVSKAWLRGVMPSPSSEDIPPCALAHRSGDGAIAKLCRASELFVAKTARVWSSACSTSR